MLDLKILNSIPKLPQRQDSLTDQLTDLVIVANKFGMYDAADYLKHLIKNENHQ